MSCVLSACLSLTDLVLSCPHWSFSSLHPAGTQWGQETRVAQHGRLAPSTAGTGSPVASLASLGSRAEVEATAIPPAAITQLSSFTQAACQALNGIRAVTTRPEARYQQCHRLFLSTCSYIFSSIRLQLSPARDNPTLHGQRGSNTPLGSLLPCILLILFAIFNL